MNFNKNLTFLRKKKGLILVDLAVEMGFSRSQWNNYELGTSYPKFLDLIKISQYFDISETDLIHKDLSIESFESPKNSHSVFVKVDFDLKDEVINLQRDKIQTLEKNIQALINGAITTSELNLVAEPNAEYNKKDSQK